VRKRKHTKVGDYVYAARRNKPVDRAVEVVRRETHDGTQQIQYVLDKRITKGSAL
jgi:hypothetical protein